MGLAGKEAGSGGATHCPTDPPLPDSPAAQHSLIFPGHVSPFPLGQT